ncbi:unnamed protein product, partial [marine sediment metagenome]
MIVDSEETEEVAVHTEVPLSQDPFLSVSITAGAIDMTKAAPNDRINEGDTISYTIKVYNTGNQTMTNIRVSDTLLTSLKRGT